MLKTGKQRRKLRVGKKIFGTVARPRLSVFRSNKFIYGQIIDDKGGKTLVDIQAEATKIQKGKNKTESAFSMGEALGKKAKEKKINEVIFDRGSYRYHGRVKSFADGARKGGLKF